MTRPDSHSKAAKIRREAGIPDDHPAPDAAQPDEQDEPVILPAVPEFPYGLARGPLRDILDWAAGDGLPVSYMAAAAEVAAAGAGAAVTGLDGRAGPGARLRLTASRRVLPILWQVLLGESGDGKNPPMARALEPAAERYEWMIADWDAKCELAEKDKKDAPRRPQALVNSSASMEAIVRWLSATGGAGILRNGELASFLKGLGQYKAGGGSDRYDAMDMWSGEPVSIERVGQGGRRNAIQIYVREPRLSVVGGLVLDNLKLLGPESDGLRARFLPVLPSSQVIPRLDDGDGIPESWHAAITRLYVCQSSREWQLGIKARGIIGEAVERWTARRTEGTDPVTVRTALAKADEQCFRIALVISDLENPKDRAEIPEWAARYAVARVDYSLGCWLALGSDQTMAFSRKDEVLNDAVASLRRLIERRPADGQGRRWMSRRDIERSQVGGATTGILVDGLIRAYMYAYPGTVTVFGDAGLARFPRARVADRSEFPEAGQRGPAPIIVMAPLRSGGMGECTLRKLSGPDSFRSVHSRAPDRENAGQDDASSANGQRMSPDSSPPDSSRPDSFRPDRATPGDEPDRAA
jgi:hypothetical protein